MTKTSQLSPAQPAAHPLRAGATLRIAAQRGSILYVRHGRIVLRNPPDWLSDSRLAPCLRLNAEEADRVAIDGWLEITALEAAEVLLLPPPPRPGWLGALGRRLRAPWRRLAQLRC
jgi:hypothetical protein